MDSSLGLSSCVQLLQDLAQFKAETAEELRPPGGHLDNVNGGRNEYLHPAATASFLNGDEGNGSSYDEENSVKSENSGKSWTEEEALPSPAAADSKVCSDTDRLTLDLTEVRRRPTQDSVKLEMLAETLLCRFCAQASAACVNIFDQQGLDLEILEKVAKCFPVYVTLDDQLPKSICFQCLEKVEFCYSFLEQIFNAHRALIHQLNICAMSHPNFDQVLASYFEDSHFFAPKSGSVKCEEEEEEEEEEEDPELEPETVIRKRGKRAGGKKGVKMKGPKQQRRRTSRSPNLKLKSRFTPSLTTCSNCGHKSDSSKDNFEHWALEHKDLSVEYRCFEEECEFKTNCIMSMKQHTKEHMFKEGNLTQCEICAKYFAKRQIKAHLAIHSDAYQFSCNKCGKMFKVRSALVTHEKTHDPEYTQNTFCCPECGKEYSMKHQYDAHVRRHSEIRPYRCEVCSKAFWSPNDLQYHMSIHTGLRPYPCSQCGLKFARPVDVKKHFVTRHTEPNKFACSQCPVKYNRKDQLRVHELSHTGETPFKCEVCGKGFTRKDKLVRHSDVHITDDSKYRYSCHLCEKRYTQSGSLFTHMKNSHGV